MNKAILNITLLGVSTLFLSGCQEKLDDLQVGLFNQYKPLGYARPLYYQGGEEEHVPSDEQAVEAEQESGIVWDDNQPDIEYLNDQELYTEEAPKVFFFKHASDDLTMQDKEDIRNLARMAMETGAHVLIEGHASKRVDGVRDYNKKKKINVKMGIKRAHAIANELVKYGMHPDNVQIISYGDANPNVDVGMRNQEEADRRTEVFLEPR